MSRNFGPKFGPDKGGYRIIKREGGNLVRHFKYHLKIYFGKLCNTKITAQIMQQNVALLIHEVEFYKNCSFRVCVSIHSVF